MTGLLTPGIHRQPLEPVRRASRIARCDIPVLFGYAGRGPVALPVRVDSTRHFEEVFGPPLPTGFLRHAVKGFFETGGRTAYVVRVATDAARPATVDVQTGPVTWRAEASFPWRMIDPRRLARPFGGDADGWVHVVERQIAEHGRRTPDRGQWGNGLKVEIRRASRVRTLTTPEELADGYASRFVSMAEVDQASVLELTQQTGGATTHAVLVPVHVDADRQLVRWPRNLRELGFTVGGRATALRVASVEFDVAVYLNGRLEQSFTALAPHPGHRHALTEILDTECRSVGLRLLDGTTGATFEPARLAALDWSDPRSWPREGPFALAGGADGLDDIRAATWLDALNVANQLDDAALVAAPDLVLPDVAPPPPTRATPEPVDCSDLSPRPLGRITGRVVTSGSGDRAVPVPGVEVDAAGPGGPVVTGIDGRFTVTDVPEGLVTLRLRGAGVEATEFPTQATTFVSAGVVDITLTKVVRPRPLTADEVLTVQQAMADPSRVGRYRIAILDPPDVSNLDAVTTWRARLGDSARMGLFAPWLVLPPDRGSDGHTSSPPSGHICGAFAAAENDVGVHRAGANIPLRYIEGTSLAIDDALHGTLNAVGINAIRAVPGRGIRLCGARTLSSDPAWRFLTARRIVDAVEKTLERALQWMVFEPNNEITRRAVGTTASTLLGGLHRDGTLAGDSPESSFSVRCDLVNNPEETQGSGLLVVDIAVAPTTPYEFVLFRLGRTFDALDVTENTP